MVQDVLEMEIHAEGASRLRQHATPCRDAFYYRAAGVPRERQGHRNITSPMEHAAARGVDGE